MENKWRGKCSFDMPQVLFRESDHYEVEIELSNGEKDIKPLHEIDWSKVKGWSRVS